LLKQVSLSFIAQVAPLTQTEEVFFRSLMRLVVTLPRALGDDLLRARGMTPGEYTALMHLPEAPNTEMRITELASATALSVGRMSRLLDELQERQLIAKRRSESDGRGNFACLTRQGLARLKSAYPDHLASVRPATNGTRTSTEEAGNDRRIRTARRGQPERRTGRHAASPQRSGD